MLKNIEVAPQNAATEQTPKPAATANTRKESFAD